MNLNELLKPSEILHGDLNAEIPIRGLSYDSRKVKKGDMFIAWKGQHFNGHDYIESAYQKGAVAALVQEKNHEFQDFPQIIVSDTRRLMPFVAKRFYQSPNEKLELIGITGTNGKTTVSRLIHHLYQQCEIKSGLVSTIDCRIGDWKIESDCTTPEAIDLYACLHEMVKADCKTAIIETSSHALIQNRLDGLLFNGAIFTNLSHDHLDFHKDMESYFKAKSLLFEKLELDGKAILGGDDPYTSKLKDRLAVPVVDFGLSHQNMIYASQIRCSSLQTSFVINTPLDSIAIKTSLIGEINVVNILAAFSYLWSKGIDVNKIKEAIESFTPLEGRLQILPIKAPFKIVVDYAHTPDALQKVLRDLRKIAKNNLICLVGCGGDRDQGKREMMGKVAGENADRVVLTTDNPRREEPRQIIRKMEIGIRETQCPYRMIEDRREAIEEAIKDLEIEDVLVIAGKGHEKYQEIGNEKIPFHDASVAKDICLNQKQGVLN